MPHPLALANAAYLAQGARLLRGLSDAQYRNSSPPLSQSGVGGHFRHCLEHLQLLLGERLARLPLPAPTLALRLHCDQLQRSAAPNGELFPTRQSQAQGLTRLLERLRP